MASFFRRKSTADGKSSELAAEQDTGKTFKRVCADTADRLAKRAKAQSAVSEQFAALDAHFADAATSLSEKSPDLARELAKAATWHATLGEFAAAAQRSMDEYREKTKQFVDSDYANAKRMSDAYEKKRSAHASTVQKVTKAAKQGDADALKEAEKDRDDAKQALDAAEREAIATWQTLNRDGVKVLREGMLSYMNDQASYYKMAHALFEDQKNSGHGVFGASGSNRADRSQTMPIQPVSPRAQDPTPRLSESNEPSAPAPRRMPTSRAMTGGPSMAGGAPGRRQFPGARAALPGMDLTAGRGASSPSKPSRPVAQRTQTQYQSLPSAPGASPRGSEPLDTPASEPGATPKLDELDDFLLEELAELDDLDMDF